MGDLTTMGKFIVELELSTDLHPKFREMTEKRYNHRNIIVLFKDIAENAIMSEIKNEYLKGVYTKEDLKSLIKEFELIIEDLKNRMKACKT